MTTENEQNLPDPTTVLCRIVDVNSAIQNTFKRFVDSEGQSLDDFANLLKEELSQIELFAPSAPEEVKKPGG